MIGTTIDSYEVTGVVAEGATGDLLVARMPGAQATVAIRLYAASLSADREAIQRCFDDATKAGGLNHSGVARVLFSGFHGDRAFLVFDHADGETLAARLAKGGRMSSTQVADLARKIADVLATAHAAKIQHRDLRPERILIVPDASGHEGVRVLDFGASHLEPTPATPSAATYAAPERWTNPGSVGVLADMYSLGAIAFHMATGQTPFHGSIDELRAQHLSAPPPPARGVMPDIPAPLEHLVGKMMAKSPGERPDKMVDVVRAFQVLGGGALATAPLATTEAFQEVLQSPTVAHGTNAAPQSVQPVPAPMPAPAPAPAPPASAPARSPGAILPAGLVLTPPPAASVSGPAHARDAGSTMQTRKVSGGGVSPAIVVLLIGLVVALGVTVAILVLR